MLLSGGQGGSGSVGDNGGNGGDVVLQGGAGGAFAGTGSTTGGDAYVDGGAGTGVAALPGTVKIATQNPASVMIAQAAGKVGFFGAAPVSVPAGGANASLVAAGITPAFNENTYDGGVGGGAYTVGEIVAALKALGLLT